MATLFLRLSMAFVMVGFFSGSLAMASGGMEGGGGKSVVCRNSDGSIRTAEVLDLYEARIVYQLPYSELATEWHAQVVSRLESAGVTLWQHTPRSGIYDWFLNAKDHLVFLPKGTTLKPIDDALEAIIPEGCNLEQTVNYQNDLSILVNSEIWGALSETQRAALLIHESTYRMLRADGETNSRRARHLTAFIFGDGKVEDTYPGRDSDAECFAGGFSEKFTAFNATLLPKSSDVMNRKIRLQFSTFGGRRLLSRAYVDIDYEIKGADGKPISNVIEQLKQPTIWYQFMGLTLSSSFEPGDQFNLFFTNGVGDSVVKFGGSSIFDPVPFGNMKVDCSFVVH